MDIYVCAGHDLNDLELIAVPMRTEKYISWEKQPDSTGLMHNVGGGSATFHAAALSYDEAETLLDQLGLSLAVPSAFASIVIPDDRRFPQPYYGVVTLEIGEHDTGNWWSNFRLQWSAMVAA